MTHRIQGEVDDYDVEGAGTCLTTALIAYAEDCRSSAEIHQATAAALLIEAERAEIAANAIEITPKPEADRG